MNRLISGTRFVIILAVLGTLVASVTALVYGVIDLSALVMSLLEGDDAMPIGSKALVLELIEIVDLFLLGTVFLIIGVGLYELFIDDNVNLPKWLEIRTLDDLKTKLIGVVIVVLGVLFLGQVATWDGERDLLGYGAAVALVIAALTYFLGFKTKGKTGGRGDDADQG